MSTEHISTIGSREFRTVVDIGANRGQFSLLCRMCFPDARVYAFEPLPSACSRYRRVFRDDPRFSLHEFAIGREDGSATIHVSRRDDSSSLLPIGELQSHVFPGTEERKTQTVRVSPLGRFISAATVRPPALLKIDVQGFELEVLKGSEELLSFFECVYVECSYVELYEGQVLAPQVVDYLNARGFRLSSTHNTLSDQLLGPVQADFLFDQCGLPLFDSKVDIS